MSSGTALDFINRLNWDIGSGNINDIEILDPNINNHRKLNQQEINLMNQPVNNKPLVLYMTASDNYGEKRVYPENMNIFQILGAIYNYYQEPITIPEVRSSPHANEEYRKEVLRRIAKGERIPRIEWMGDHTSFAGFQPHNEGYSVTIES